ncbi:MAG TPA: ribonuclease H family protein [Saprospiraceae bacterium]|nr:ribonuclease H family protein [Saprospiraceae bacterium]
MKAKKKFYVVWQGQTPGVYHSWEDCLKQVKAYPDAKYKSFESLDEANDAYLSGYSYSGSQKVKATSQRPQDWKKVVPVGSITVDAACQGNPGKMEYRGVDPYSGVELFHQGPFVHGTNNIGEFLALVHALALLKKLNKHQTPIYTDSKTAMSWVKRKIPNTKIEFNASNKAILDLLNRATQWLNQNTYSNPIIKWETEIWGEIPADFGRK